MHRSKPPDDPIHDDSELPRPVGVILVVEDDESNRRLLEQILGFAGYQHLSATNGQEALEVLDRAHVDVVLLDLDVPVLNGYETAGIIRARPTTAAMPIVAVTGFAMPGDRELALSAGCTEYLSKPFGPGQLLEMVKRMLALAGIQ
ncbi:MAG TPA: response regulator [Ktedonobacterales bacterium]|jgi:two-component system cell cycle response regulator DivK|nr:response regulator [Ktedonobacterales bacterium]